MTAAEGPRLHPASSNEESMVLEAPAVPPLHQVLDVGRYPWGSDQGPGALGESLDRGLCSSQVRSQCNLMLLSSVGVFVARSLRRLLA